MSLFSMRDSWNVWRRKVDEALGGSVEPIESEDVVYDNTDSGLTATNVQNAIDEVAGSLAGYTLTDFDSLTYTPNNDTYGSALDHIASDMSNVLSSLEDDEMIMSGNLVITGIATLICRKQPLYKTDGAFNAVAFSVNPSASSMSIYGGVLYGGSGNSFIDKIDTGNSLAFQNITDNALTSSNTIRVSYFKFKKLK